MESAPASRKGQIVISERYATLGQRMRKARQAHGMTQEQLAGPEFTKGYISALERGAVRPSLKALEVFARRLDMHITDFLVAQVGDGGAEIVALEEDLNFQFNYARMLIRSNQVDEAFQMLADAEHSSKPHLDKLSVRARYRVPFLRGLAYLQQSEPALARPELEAALEIARVGKADDEITTSVRNLLGVAFYQLEQPQLALEQHLQCLRAVQTGVVKDLSLRLSVYRNLANDYWALNDLTQAIGVYREALTLVDDVSDLERQAGVFWGLAGAYKAASDWPQAKLYATRALYIYEAAENRAAAASISMNLAEMLVGEKRYGDAAELLERAKGLLAGTGDNVLLSNLYHNYADLARRQGKLDQASEYVGESVKISADLYNQDESDKKQAGQAPRQTQVNATRAHAEALHMAALIEEELGHKEAADNFFKSALERIRQTSFEERAYAIAFSYAEVLQARGAYEQAMEYYRNAAQVRPHTTQLGQLGN